jgi:selenide,water dikinase
VRLQAVRGRPAPIVAGLPRPTTRACSSAADTADDAGVVQLSDDLAIVQTADFFTPIVDDPYAFGRIAATNALSDVYAMGGRPVSRAQPRRVSARDARARAALREILRGGADAVAAAGASIVGGHSIDDPSPSTGSRSPASSTRARADQRGRRDGDALVLTKPLGAGAVATALKRGSPTRAGRARRRGDERRSTPRPPSRRARPARSALTDVTGFGLLGHVHELAEASGLAAEIDAAAVPAIDGVLELLADERAVAGGSRRNRADAEAFATFADGVEEPRRRLVCDA